MKTVIERELRAFLHTRLAWIMAAILVLLNGSLITYYHFYLGNTRYEILLGTAMLVLCALLPLWIVPRFNREEGSEEDRFLMSLPISKTEIFFGKLLSAFSVLLGFTLILGVFPLVLAMLGAVQTASDYAGLFVAFLLGSAVLSVLIFVSVICRKRVVAWLVAYGFLVVLFVLSNLTGLFGGAFADVVSYLSLFDAFSPFAYSLFAWRLLLWYIGIALAFLGSTFFVVAKRQKEDSEDGMSKKALLSLVMAAVLLVATVATAFLPASVSAADMTAEKVMTVSTTTKKYLGSLKEDVTIYLLTDDMSKTPYKNDRFEAFLDRYASYGDRVSLERVPVSQSGQLLAEFGVTPSAEYAYCILVESPLRKTVISYGDMLYYMHENDTLSYIVPREIAYNDYEYYLSALYQYATSDSTYAEYYYAFLQDVKLHFVGETLLNQSIEYTVRDLIPKTYVLTGHGEPDLSGILLGNLMSGCTPLKLSAVSEIPADAAAVLLLAPTSDYSATEIRMLSSYLERGGSLNVLTDEKNLDMPNLMGLLKDYGMSAEKGAVQVEVEQSTTDESGNKITAKVVTASVPVSVNKEHDALAAISSIGIADGMICIEGGNAISFHKTENSSLITTPLLTTSKSAFVGDKEQMESKVLGAAAETSNGAKLVWFTGAKNYLINSSAITEESEESIIYPLFCPYLSVGWTGLVYTSNLAELPAMLYEEPYLQANDTVMIVFGVLMIAVIPMGLIAIGTIGHYKRKKA